MTRDWLEVTTPQGAILKPDVFSGSVNKKYGQIWEAKLCLSEGIPDDSLCTLLVAHSQKLFEGVCRRYYWDPRNGHSVEIYSHLERTKPNFPKAGLFLGRYVWENVQIQQFLSSDEPDDNDGIVGMLYMMNSLIYYELWDVQSADLGIWKWSYTGLPYTITKVYSDGAQLTSRASLDILEIGTNSGFYHDVANQVLYIRLADETSPYYHAITVPNIWDGEMPIRLGEIFCADLTSGTNDWGTTWGYFTWGEDPFGTSTSKKEENVIYWETANGDVPFETLNTFLIAIGLEYEESIRNDVCCIDITDSAGFGSALEPANTYLQGENILAIQQIDLSDARFQCNGVILPGYGQGSSAIIAGKHVNLGRGGRFVRIEDPTQHSESMAEKFADVYLSQKQQPDHKIVFDVPLLHKKSQAVDLRQMGDYLRTELPALHFDMTLRTQAIDIKLGKETKQTLTIGDRLVTPEQTLQAIKKANENYRKHLEDETEAYDISFNENIDHNLDLTFPFKIDADVLAIQKLELTINIDRTRADVTQAISSYGGVSGSGTGTTPSTIHKHRTLTLQAIASASKVAAVTSIGTTTDTAIKSLSTTTLTVVTGFGTVSSDTAIKTLSTTTQSVVTGLGTPSTDTAIKTLSTTTQANVLVATAGTPALSDVVLTLSTTTQSVVTGLSTPSTDTAIKSLSTTTQAVMSSLGTPSTDTAIKTLASACCTAVNCGKEFATKTPAATIAVVTGYPNVGWDNVIKTVSANATIAAVTGYPNVAWETVIKTVAVGTTAKGITGITTLDVATVIKTVSANATIAAVTGYPNVAWETVIKTVAAGTTITALTAITLTTANAIATVTAGSTITALIGITPSTTDVSLAWHTHDINAFDTNADDDLGNSEDIKRGFVSWTTNNNGDQVQVLVKVGNYNYGSDPDMFMHAYIDNTEIVGSPYIVSSSQRQAGPVILNPDYVSKAGTYELKLKLANKTAPGAACRCRITASIRGRCFVDTVFGKGG